MNEDYNMGKTVCASCGSAEVDGIKLKECNACKSVRYCSDACQKNHKSQHKEACKKRAAELHDEILFKQPESRHDGDCPICCLPMPLDKQKSFMMACCSKTICKGCFHANQKREAKASLNSSCSFCRQPVPKKDELGKQRMKRIEANDPVVLCEEGIELYNKGDHQSALEYYTRATGLGNVEAHYQLAYMNRDGHGVEKDWRKYLRHLVVAAIGGHPTARYNLGCIEWHNGNNERAAKHFIIAAKLGDDDSIKSLMDAYRGGFVSKDDLATTLRAHQAADDATKSPQREAAEEYYQNKD